MRISSLHLKSFRNIEDQHICPGQGFNLLVGANAQGKTNVIESIALVSTGQSFRNQDFRDMIQEGQLRAEVCAETQGEIGKDKYAIIMDSKRKTFLRNEKRARGSQVYTVLFAPEEIMLIRNSPAARRKHIDTMISQLSATHRSAVSRYEKVIRQRNRILCELDVPQRVRKKLLRPWDEQLIGLGTQIVTGRSQWCNRLNTLMPERYTAIAPNDPTAALKYVPCCGERALEGGTASIEDALASQLEMRQQDELARGFTVVGPHRDEFEARIGVAGVKRFGSQGQHRSFILALKMSEMRLLKEASGEEPILLLDDVASELDTQRNRFFFESLRQTQGQVFITATSEADLDIKTSQDVLVFGVDSGRLIPRK